MIHTLLGTRAIQWTKQIESLLLGAYVAVDETGKKQSKYVQYIVCQWSRSAEEKIKSGKESRAYVPYMGGM